MTQFDGFKKKIIDEVDQMLPLFISRKGVNPLVDVINFMPTLGLKQVK